MEGEIRVSLRRPPGWQIHPPPAALARRSIVSYMDRLAGKLPVLDAFGLVRVLSLPPMQILLITGKIAVEPVDVAVALKRQDVCGDAIQKPAIVGDDHGAAGEIFEPFLEGA